jgi:antitoxin YefM
MTILNVTEARTNLYRLMEQVADSHEPVTITGKRANSVLISQDDWFSIQETLYLLSIPGMGKSIKDGLSTDLDACDKDLKW